MKQSRVIIDKLSYQVLDRTIFLRMPAVQSHAYRQVVNQTLDIDSFIFYGLAITLECLNVKFSVWKNLLLVDSTIRSEVGWLDSVPKHEKFEHLENIHSVNALFCQLVNQ
jgi:hypothetical protein